MASQRPAPAADPFGTDEIRRRVLAGWAASPARFREDANTEEDFALGGYRDRLVVELAQNAADAAVRAGVSGRLRLTLTRDALYAANNGEPLTVDGVQSLATLRASRKPDTPGPDAVDRDAPGGHAPDLGSGSVVGRFGVGFAAVLAVTDEPEVRSRSGGVRFSRAETAAEVSALPELAAELTRRSGHVPVLRLPYPIAPSAAGEPAGEPGELDEADEADEAGVGSEGVSIPDGFDTVVRLPLRDQAAYAVARQALLEVDDPLLLALPALRSIEIDIRDDLDAGTGADTDTGTGIDAGADTGAGHRVLAEVEQRWRVFRTGGFWTRREREELFADRPTEERTRAAWTVTWALRLLPTGPDHRDQFGLDHLEQFGSALDTPGSGADGLGVLHAPTPTDEAISLPALLIASFPLDPNRRRVQPGPLADRLLDEAARAYAEMLTILAREDARARAGTTEPAATDARRPPTEVIADVLAMVPTGLPVGDFDARLSEAIRELLPRVPLLRAVVPADDAPQAVGAPGDETANAGTADAETDRADMDGADRPLLLSGRDAVAVDGLDDTAAEALASVVPNLVRPRAAGRAVLDVLGVRRVGLAEVVEELAGVAESRSPAWWRRWYDACADLAADPLAAEALGALPVPLADGRTVRGPRGVLLPYGEVGSDALAVLVRYGIRVAHPDATSATLERLGARPADPLTLLREPATREAVRSAADAPERSAGESADVVTAILRLVRAAAGTLRPGSLPWLAELPLPDNAGELVPAGTLVLPGSPAERLLDPEEFAVAADELVDRWGAETLTALGVPRDLGVLWAEDVDLAALPEELLDLPDVEDWAEEQLATGREPLLGEFVAVRDLDLVAEDAWPEALRLLGSDPRFRPALLAEPSYTAWWIAGYLRSDGTADPDADADLASLLPAAPDELVGLDPVVRGRLGTRRSLTDLGVDDLAVVLDALADPETDLEAGTLIRVWRRLAELAEGVHPASLPQPPEQVRVLDGAGTRLVTDAVVADSPMWLQLEQAIGETGLVAAPPGADRTLAAVFDLPLIQDVAPELFPEAGRQAGGLVPEEPGARAEVPDAVRRLAPSVPEFWYEHDEVRVAGQAVDWWVDADGVPHAATTDGLARGLAWAAGAESWPARYAIAAVLSDPEAADTVLQESAFDPGH